MRRNRRELGEGQGQVRPPLDLARPLDAQDVAPQLAAFGQGHRADADGLAQASQDLLLRAAGGGGHRRLEGHGQDGSDGQGVGRGLDARRPQRERKDEEKDAPGSRCHEDLLWAWPGPAFGDSRRMPGPPTVTRLAPARASSPPRVLERGQGGE